MAAASAQKTLVDLYEITNNEGLSRLKVLEGFKSSVVNLDFSSDGFYLMAEDSLGGQVFFNMENCQVVSL